MPRLLDVDRQQERLLKEYVDGDTINVLVKEGRMQESYRRQMLAMCQMLYAANLNIDYYPTNFVVEDGQVFYIDYECNPYMDQWNFENWGGKYWEKTEEFILAFGE